MNPWWWVPIGLAAWFLVAIVGQVLLIGPVLRRSSQARGFASQEPEELSGAGEPPHNERQAS